MRRTRSVYEVFAEALNYANGKLIQIRLLAADLQFDKPYGIREYPQYAMPELGKQIIAQFAALSSEFGAKIKYDPELNQGLVASI